MLDLLDLAFSVIYSTCLGVAGSQVAQCRAKQVTQPNLSPGVYMPTKNLGYLMFKSIAGLHFLKKIQTQNKETVQIRKSTGFHFNNKA